MSPPHFSPLRQGANGLLGLTTSPCFFGGH